MEKIPSMPQKPELAPLRESQEAYFDKIRTLRNEIWKEAGEKLGNDNGEGDEWFMDKQVEFLQVIKDIPETERGNCIAFHAFMGSSMHPSVPIESRFEDFPGPLAVEHYASELLKELKDK